MFMEEFEKIIKKYLDHYANESPEFKSAYSKENKTIEKCCSYIVSEMRKHASDNNIAATDDEVYYLARHYYEEDNLDANKDAGNFSFVHTVAELTDEDKENLKKQALNEFLAEEKKKLEELEKKKKERQEKKEARRMENQGQLSLFD